MALTPFLVRMKVNGYIIFTGVPDMSIIFRTGPREIGGFV